MDSPDGGTDTSGERQPRRCQKYECGEARGGGAHQQMCEYNSDRERRKLRVSAEATRPCHGDITMSKVEDGVKKETIK